MNHPATKALMKTLLTAFAISAAIVSSTRAATLVEYFNGYGGTTAGISTVGTAGEGWAGAWASPGVESVSYGANTSLTYTAPGYSNLGNLTGTSDGSAVKGPSGGDGDVSVRSFSTEMTGTIWVSALGRVTTSPSETSRVSLRFDSVEQSGANETYIALYDTKARLVARGGITETALGSVSLATTHLMLARIVIDESGVNDSIEYWFNPNLTGGVAGLGAATLSSSGSDLFGTGISSIGLSMRRNGSQLDSIRISNDASGFDLVTTAIPEPSSAAMLGGVGALLCVAMRRRQRAL